MLKYYLIFVWDSRLVPCIEQKQINFSRHTDQLPVLFEVRVVCSFVMLFPWYLLYICSFDIQVECRFLVNYLLVYSDLFLVYNRFNTATCLCLSWISIDLCRGLSCFQYLDMRVTCPYSRSWWNCWPSRLFQSGSVVLYLYRR